MYFNLNGYPKVSVGSESILRCYEYFLVIISFASLHLIFSMKTKHVLGSNNTVSLTMAILIKWPLSKCKNLFVYALPVYSWFLTLQTKISHEPSCESLKWTTCQKNFFLPPNPMLRIRLHRTSYLANWIFSLKWGYN